MLECEIRAPVPFHTLMKTNTGFFILHYCHIKGRNLLRCNLQHLEIYKVLSKEPLRCLVYYVKCLQKND